MWRSSPLPPDWKRTQRRILERDEHRCRATLSDGTRCTHEATDVHHLGDPNDHRDEMLVAACSWHHKRDTSQRANAARRRVTQRREPEKHPGLRE